MPVIRDADTKSITELAAAVSDVAERARGKKIQPDELEGGSFSVSNQGGIGGTAFTPIVLWPQAAILGVSRATVEPVWRNDRFETAACCPWRSPTTTGSPTGPMPRASCALCANVSSSP